MLQIPLKMGLRRSVWSAGALAMVEERRASELNDCWNFLKVAN
jgi:hypothetical protein